MKDSLSHNHRIQLRTMQLLVRYHYLPLLYFLLLYFTVLRSYCLPTSLPPDTTFGASEQQISSMEGSLPFATLQTTPLVTLNGAEIPMEVVPLEEMGSRYFSYLTEGPLTTLEIEATTSAPQTDTILVKEKTIDGTVRKPLEGVKSTSVSPPVITKISKTPSIETTKVHEFATKLANSEESMVSNNNIPDEEVKLVTKSATPPLVARSLMTSEASKPQDLITTTVTTPIITYLHMENTKLLTPEQSDLQRVATLISTSPGPEMSEIVQTGELKKATLSITTSQSAQESVIITNGDELITTASSSIETPLVTISVPTSANVEATTLLNISASVTEIVSSAVPSDLPTAVVLLTTPASVGSTKIAMGNAKTTNETTGSASKFQEQILTAKAEETVLQEVATTPITTVTSAVTENIQKGTSISGHSPKVSTVEPIVSTIAELSVTTVETQVSTSVQSLTSAAPLTQNTPNVQLTHIATMDSEISDKTSSTTGVIAIQTTEGVPLTTAPSETNNKISPATSSSNAVPKEVPVQIATEIKNENTMITIVDVIAASKPEEIATAVITTSAPPTAQPTQSIVSSDNFFTNSTVSTEPIQSDVVITVTTEPPKADIISTEIGKTAELLTTTGSLAESTVNIIINVSGSTGASNEKAAVVEVITETEPEISKSTTTAIETIASVIPEVIITSTAVFEESATEIPPSAPRSVTQIPRVKQSSATTAHSIPEKLSTHSITATTETTMLSSLPQSSFSVSEKIKNEVAPTPPSSVISEIVSRVQPIGTTPFRKDPIPEIPESSKSPIVSDTTKLQSLSLTSTEIAVTVTTEAPSSTPAPETKSATSVYLKDAGSTYPLVWTGTEAQNTLPAEKIDTTTGKITKTIQNIPSRPQLTEEEQLQTQPPALPTSAVNVETVATSQIPRTPLYEKPEITTFEITTAVSDKAAVTEPPKKEEIQTTPPTEIAIKELIQTTKAPQPVATEKRPDPIKPAVDPIPQRPKDPDSEGMTLATAISMGLILIFLLILLCILAVSLIAGWIHCRGRDSRQPKVSLIRVERGLATEFADSWSKGMSAQAWMTTQSGTTTMNPLPSTSSPQPTMQPPGPPQSQNFHCRCKRRVLFRRANRLCMVHGDSSTRHPTNAVRAVKIISLSDNSDGEGADAVLLTELGRRRASGASNAPGGGEEDSRDVGKGRGEWLFIDEA